jgi:hypothetical protein
MPLPSPYTPTMPVARPSAPDCLSFVDRGTGIIHTCLSITLLAILQCCMGTIDRLASHGLRLVIAHRRGPPTELLPGRQRSGASPRSGQVASRPCSLACCVRASTPWSRDTPPPMLFAMDHPADRQLPRGVAAGDGPRRADAGRTGARFNALTVYASEYSAP